MPFIGSWRARRASSAGYRVCPEVPEARIASTGKFSGLPSILSDGFGPVLALLKRLGRPGRALLSMIKTLGDRFLILLTFLA